MLSRTAENLYWLARYLERAKNCSLERTACDYLAGMTDRFAQAEYIRLFHPTSAS